MSKPLLPSMSEFVLMHNEAERVLKQLVGTELQRVSLSMNEWLALSVIVAGPRDGVGMGEIANRLVCSLPQVTALVAALQDRKLCKQHIAAQDRRGRQVLPTLKGRRLLGNLELDMQMAFEAFAAGLDPEKVAAYIEINTLLANSKNSLATDAAQQAGEPAVQAEPSSAKRGLRHGITWKEV